MTHKIFFLLGIIFIAQFSLSQNASSINLAVSVGSFNFIKSTWFKQQFYESNTTVPSFTVDVPISNSLSLNAKLLYISHKDETFWETYNFSERIVKQSVGNSTIKEYLIFPRLQYQFYESSNLSLNGRLGIATGYIKEEFVSYPLSLSFGSMSKNYSFGILGVAGGFGIKNRFENSPISIFVNIDSYYSYRGEQSLIQEYDGILYDFGIGIDL